MSCMQHCDILIVKGQLGFIPKGMKEYLKDLVLLKS